MIWRRPQVRRTKVEKVSSICGPKHPFEAEQHIFFGDGRDRKGRKEDGERIRLSCGA
jgi:hypothetical protein